MRWGAVKRNHCRYIAAAAQEDAVERPYTLGDGLCFDAQEALVLAQRCGLKSAAQKLLLLRGDYSAAIALSEDVKTASGCVAQAPAACHRDLWLQYAQRQAAKKAGVAELQNVVEASGGAVSPEDLLPLIPKGGSETVQQIAELVAKHLDAESAELILLDKQFDGLGDCMTVRRNALQDLQQDCKNMGKHVTAASTCASCGNPMSRQSKSGRVLGVRHLPAVNSTVQWDSLHPMSKEQIYIVVLDDCAGDSIPPAVVFLGGQYHLDCGVQSHLRIMSDEECQRWPWVVDAFKLTIWDNEMESSRRQAVGEEYLLERLQDFFKQRGDPLLSTGLITSISDVYGEREEGHEDQLLQLPNIQDV